MEQGYAQAVALARAGDQMAFRQLVEHHSRSIFRLAFRITANEQDAEDVVQETFLKLHRNLDKFQDRSTLGTWLYRIAIHEASNQRRWPNWFHRNWMWTGWTTSCATR